VNSQSVSAKSLPSQANAKRSKEIDNEVNHIIAKEVELERSELGLPPSSNLFDEKEQAECTCEQEEEVYQGPQSNREGQSNQYYHHSRSEVTQSTVPDVSDAERIEAFVKRTQSNQANQAHQASQAHQTHPMTLSVDANQLGSQSMMCSANSLVFLGEDPAPSTYAQVVTHSGQANPPHIRGGAGLLMQSPTQQVDPGNPNQQVDQASSNKGDHATLSTTTHLADARDLQQSSQQPTQKYDSINSIQHST
jgi:hypothetical protein